ncbi:MAG: adenylate/guanylate cyclase domain-containing protein [Sphingomonadaceae bacterium]
MPARNSRGLPALKCPHCGTALPATAKFCIECGRPVTTAAIAWGCATVRQHEAAATAEPQGERKLITVLFADLKGSTELIADRDPEQARRLIDPVIEHMCHAVEQHGGTVSEIMGDGVMALFGAPIAAEDHAARACHAALTMLELVRHYDDEIQHACGFPIQIRVGLNSGDAIVQMTGRGLHKSYTAIGLTVHIASRMEQMAKPGTALATADTVRLAKGCLEVTPIGPIHVKGVDRAIEAAEIRRAATTRSRFDTAPGRALTRFVGRDAELQVLQDAFMQVVRERVGRLLAIAGDAGMGKSRLVYEFLRTLANKDVLALDGGPAPYGSGAPYRPGAHILAQYFHVVDEDDAATVREKVAGGIIALGGETDRIVVPVLALLHALPASNSFHGLPVNERRQQVAAALLWLARHVAADRPVVLVYEDLQWITSDTRNFLETLVANPVPSMLVIVTYRADYDARLPTTADTLELRLDGLTVEGARALSDALLGADASLEGLKDELGRRSGGNPLFIEEHVRSMVDSGDLAGEPGRYRLAALRQEIEIAPTVRAILAARIDRLSHEEKHLLQAIAAVGAVAPVGALARVLDLPIPALRRSLMRLQVTGLLIERTGQHELEYEFKHSLTQAVAYETLVFERRRELHRRIMAALAATAPPEVLAQHALQAEAWEQALGYLLEAGERASLQFAEVEAVAFLERALEVADRLAPEKRSLAKEIDIRFALRNALVPLGRQQQNLEVLLEAEKLAVRIGDEPRRAQALSSLSTCYGTIGRPELALDAAERSLKIAERLSDPRMLLVGALSAGEIHRALGDFHKARSYLMRAVELGDANDAQSLQGQVGLPSVRARSHLAWTLAELGDFAGAHRAAEEGLRLADAAKHAYSVAHACLALGGTRLRQGEFVAAIPILERGLTVSEQVPLLRPPIAADLGVARARCGDVTEGLGHLHAAIDGARAMERLSRLPLIVVKCGEVHLLAGETDEAERLAMEALRLAVGQRERGNEAYARRLLAEIHGERGALEGLTTERGYVDALALAAELDMQPLVARCHAGLGLWLRQAERREEAQCHLDVAVAMFRGMAMRFWLDKLESDRGEVVLNRSRGQVETCS